MGTQTLGTYIYKRQETLAEWVALRPILEVYDKETGYKGRVGRRGLWWWQKAAWNQLSVMLEDILAVVRARCW